MNRCKFLFPILFALAIAAGCVLTGCSDKKSADYLAYQREGGSYLCKVTQGEAEYEILLELGEPMRLDFRAPQTLAGYRFERSGEEIRLFFEDLELPAADSDLPERVSRLFSLSEGNFLSASHEKVSGEEITVVNFADGEILRLSSDGAPLMLTDGDLVVSILHRETAPT